MTIFKVTTADENGTNPHFVRVHGPLGPCGECLCSDLTGPLNRGTTPGSPGCRPPLPGEIFKKDYRLSSYL
jgi:hypothetical protein